MSKVNFSDLKKDKEYYYCDYSLKSSIPLKRWGSIISSYPTIRKMLVTVVDKTYINMEDASGHWFYKTLGSYEYGSSVSNTLYSDKDSLIQELVQELNLAKSNIEDKLQESLEIIQKEIVKAISI